MNIRIFIDFGSTFTKVVAFDLKKEELAARAQAPSTVDTNVMTGLNRAIDGLRRLIPVTEDNIKAATACSSAAGGLKMVCIGLVPEYTTEAGRLAALGAGAKVIKTYSYELSSFEVREIEGLKPDIVLLTGGTDGGNIKTIIHNAGLLSEAGGAIRNIIVAGNKSASDDISTIFKGRGKNVVIAKNVMPEFGMLDIEPVNEVIRELFIKRIIEAKGINAVRERIGGVIMPTPSAVLQAVNVLADGTYAEAGIGEMLAVDVGGATTDVYSVGYGAPIKGGVSYTGLPEPYAKRTVEGDLGQYHNLDTLIGLARNEHINLEGCEPCETVMDEMKKVYSITPGGGHGKNQEMLSRLAVRTATDRHTGRLDRRITTNGEVWFQRGKDLREIKTVLGTGGPLAFSMNPRFVLEGAANYGSSSPILKPFNPSYYLDRSYILFAIGLLSLTEHEKALRIFKKYIIKL